MPRRRDSRFLQGLAVGLILGASAALAVRRPPAGEGGWSARVYFCPEDGCSHVVIRWIERANESVDVAMYSFTLDSIGEALVRAAERGVRVRVILERDQVNQYSEYSRLRDAGIDVVLDSNAHLMHDKFAVIDGKVVLTGSFNWSLSADRYNDENLLILRSGDLASEYESEFDEMWAGTFGG